MLAHRSCLITVLPNSVSDRIHIRFNAPWPRRWPDAPPRARPGDRDRARPARMRQASHGAESNPLDAIRAARGHCRGPGRVARVAVGASSTISVPLVARRSAVKTGPVVAGAPARRLGEEAAEYEKALDVVVRSWRPDLLEQLGIGPIVAATCCAPGPTQAASTSRPLRDARWRRFKSPPTVAGSVAGGTGSTATAIVRATALCTPSRYPASATTQAPATTSPAASRRAKTSPRDQTLHQELLCSRAIPTTRTPTAHGPANLRSVLV